MTDRQAALREALEKRISYLSDMIEQNFGTARVESDKELASLRHNLKRLGHCNTCGGVGSLTTPDKDPAKKHVIVPCPDCVPDEIELSGKMGK